MTTSPVEQVDLLLDDMFSPRIASTLRDRGWRVVAVAERVDLRALMDEEVYAWAAGHPGCWLLSENVKDYQPIAYRALQAGTVTAGLLFTSSRRFPRSRQNPGPLIEALDAWLTKGRPAPPLSEDWLHPAEEA